MYSVTNLCCLQTMVSNRTTPLAAFWTTDRYLLNLGYICHTLKHRTEHALVRSPTHIGSLSQCFLAHEKLFSQKVLEDLTKTSFTSHLLLCQTHQS